MSLQRVMAWFVDPFTRPPDLAWETQDAASIDIEVQAVTSILKGGANEGAGPCSGASSLRLGASSQQAQRVIALDGTTK